MSKDYDGWPLVPCDPAAIPEGYEPVRVGWPHVGEVAASLDKSAVSWTLNYAEDISPRLIIRPIPDPIRLPLTIVPHGWWLYKSNGGQVYVSEEKPTKLGGGLVPRGGKAWCLPPWIAAQLPAEWNALPWGESMIQQTEGGEG